MAAKHPSNTVKGKEDKEIRMFAESGEGMGMRLMIRLLYTPITG